MDKNHTMLSESGESRKAAILADAQRLAQRRRRDRIAARTAAVALPLLAAGLLWWALPREAPRALHAPVEVAVQIPPRPAPVAQPVSIKIIQTDPTLAEKWSAGSYAPIAIVDDRRLLALLADAHLPAGLAVVDGQTRVVWHERR